MKVHYKLVSEKVEDFSTVLNKWIDKGYKLAGDLQVISTKNFSSNSVYREVVFYNILLSINIDNAGPLNETEFVFLENGIEISEDEFNHNCKYQTITVGYPFKLNDFKKEEYNWYLKYERKK